MNGKGTVLVAVSIAMVMACVGVGYAAEYSASTVNSNNGLQATYMVLELNDNAMTSQCTFHFNDLVYYRDRSIVPDSTSQTGYSAVDVYKSNAATSQQVKVFVRSVSATATLLDKLEVRLAYPDGYDPLDPPIAPTDAVIVLQFYSDDGCTTPFGSAITMSYTNQRLIVGSDILMDHAYYCKATITVNTTTLDTANNGAGTISFGIIFTATAVET